MFSIADVATGASAGTYYTKGRLLDPGCNRRRVPAGSRLEPTSE